MKRFRRILVPLSFSDADSSVVAMTDHLAKWSQPDEIVFCHFNPKVKMPAALQKSHPWPLEPMDEAARSRMQAFVKKHSELPEDTKIRFHVEEANATLQMNEFSMCLDYPKDSFATAVHHREFVPFGILDYVKQNGIDCFVAGCRGKDALSAILLGDDIEQIINHSPVPVLAVKTKGAGRSFLESILGMGQ